MNKKTYKIKELGVIVGGGTPSTAKDNYWNGNIPWISPKDLTDYENVYISRGAKNISELGYKKSSAKMLPKNTLLISSRAPIGYLALAENELCTNQGFKSLICNPLFIDYKYAYYFFSQNVEYLKIFATGATFPELSASIMSNIKVNIIEDVEYQKRIGEAIYKYDQVINNINNQINELKKIVYEVFKEWFIRFRDESLHGVALKNSPIGKIPENFKISKIKDLVDFYIGGGWGEDHISENYNTPSYVIRGADFPKIENSDISSCPFRYHKASNYKSRKIQSGDIILEISGGTEEMPVGRTVIITEGLLKQFNSGVMCASFCKLIRPNSSNISSFYLQYWFKYLYETRIIERYQLQSTGLINFQFEYFLDKGFCIIPPKKMMDNFDNFAKQIHSEIDVLAIQKDKIKKEKERLIPRLLSGVCKL